jgi:hypothetical protein
MSRLTTLLVAVFAACITVVIVRLTQGISLRYAALLLFVGIPLGYSCSRLQVYWQQRQSADLADRVVKELLRTSRQEQPDTPHMKVTPETVMAQLKIEQRLRGMEPMIVRSKVWFIPRPTKEDIQEAVQDDAVIVVRVPVPERWREKMGVPETHHRLIGRCNAVLEQIDLIGGHPRVMLLSDTCDSKAEFIEKVYERFGG